MTLLSYQLYSSRNFGPVEDTLTMLAALGFDAVEGYAGLIEGRAEALRRAMDANGIRMRSAHLPLEQVLESPRAVVESARILGFEAVFVPAIQPRQRPGDAKGWAALGQALGEAARPLAAAGIALGWHNHDYEFADLGGSDRPLDLILAGSDLLTLEDVAWAVVAGADRLVWMERYSDRLIAAHVKDLAPSGEAKDEDGWAALGYGTMDWRGLALALASTACRLLVLEHDNPADDASFACRSLEAARDIWRPA